MVSEARFFWSFYREPDPKQFFEALAAFRVDLNSRRIVIVLDGLEVIQDIPGTVAYGKLLPPEVLKIHGRAIPAETHSL